MFSCALLCFDSIDVLQILPCILRIYFHIMSCLQATIIRYAEGRSRGYPTSNIALQDQHTRCAHCQRFVYVPHSQMKCNNSDAGTPVYRPYERRLEPNVADVRTFSSVTLRPQVLFRTRIQPVDALLLCRSTETDYRLQGQSGKLATVKDSCASSFRPSSVTHSDGVLKFLTLACESFCSG